MDTDVHAPVMRYHGAKWRLAPWIVSFFPDHDTYLEPYGGSAGVLLCIAARDGDQGRLFA